MPGRRSRRAALSALLPALVLAGCGDNLSPLPDPVTRDGERMFSLWRFSNIAGLLVALLIWGLVAYCVVRFRRRGRDDLPAQSHANVPMEILYTAAPLVLVGVLFWWTVDVQEEVTATPGEPDLLVEVVGFQWQWQFRYPDAGVVVTGVPDEAPVLVLPVDRTVRFRLETVDVIHSFYVPEFLTKRDAVPGIDNEFDVEVDEPGTWVGRCAEYCGIDHFRMNFAVRAVPGPEFDRWLATQREASPR